VVFFHFSEPYSGFETVYSQIVKYGNLGVPIFFVISGYCILLSAKHSKNSIDFLIRRLFRIFPAFWLSIAIVLLVVALQVAILGQNSVTVLPKDFTAILKTLTLLTQPFGDVPTMNWVYWSLTVELFFYLLVFIGLIFTKNTLSITLIITVLSLLIPPTISTFFFWIPYWFSFSLGSTIFFYRESLVNRSMTYLLVMLSLIGLFKFHYPSNIPYLLISILISLFILISFRFKQKESRVTRLGNLSYGIYLIHIPIGVYIFNYAKTSWILKNSLYNFLFDSAGLILIAICSYFLYLHVEKRYINIGKKISNKIGDPTGFQLFKNLLLKYPYLKAKKERH